MVTRNSRTGTGRTAVARQRTRKPQKPEKSQCYHQCDHTHPRKLMRALEGILTGVSGVDEARVAGGEKRVDGGVGRRGQLSVQVVEQWVDGEASELVRHQGGSRGAHGCRQTPVAHPQRLVQTGTVHPDPVVVRVVVLVVGLVLEGPGRSQEMLEVVTGPAPRQTVLRFRGGRGQSLFQARGQGAHVSCRGRGGW